jgi:hypothetical protein
MPAARKPPKPAPKPPRARANASLGPAKPTLAPASTKRVGIEPKPRRPKPGQPEHVPTETTQAKVTIWSGGGIDLEAIAVALGISKPTLLKHYALQISVGKVTMDGLAISAIARAMRGDGKESVLAAKFWAVCRMGWTERFIVDDARLRDTPLQITSRPLMGMDDSVRCDTSECR